MFKTIFENIPVLVVSIIATITGGSAVSKIAQELQPLGVTQEREMQEISTVPTGTEPTLTVTQTPAPTASTPINSNPVSATVTTFTLVELASHNTKGSCYIAYNKVVYDVSTHPSWQNCRHHGISGGSDITSRFPHSTSYFASLPRVGTLSGGATSGNTGNTGRSDDNDQNDDDENEHENEDEDKFEFEIENEQDDD